MNVKDHFMEKRTRQPDARARTAGRTQTQLHAQNPKIGDYVADFPENAAISYLTVANKHCEKYQ